jgi:ABC-type glycerol-3-phosphate transport system substrate-binding protein
MEGKKEWDTENEPTEANWLEPTVVEALEWQLYDCFNTIKCSPTPADMQGGANQLQTGSAAMKMEGAWFLPQMQGPTAAMEGGVEFDVVAMPTGGAGKVHMGFAHVQTLNAATKHKEEAWSLLKYIGDEKAQRVWSEMTGRQPNNPDFIEKFWVPKAKEDFNFQNAEAFVKAMDTGIVHVTGLYDIEIYNEVFNPFRDEVVAGYSRAADLLPGVNQALQDMIDEYWAS